MIMPDPHRKYFCACRGDVFYNNIINMVAPNAETKTKKTKTNVKIKTEEVLINRKMIESG